MTKERLTVIVCERFQTISYFQRAALPDHETPTEPADSLFSAAELKAIQLLRFHIKEDMSEDVTINQAIIWLAQVGGYIGPSNEPRGQETIGRDLKRVQIAAEVLLAIK